MLCLVALEKIVCLPYSIWKKEMSIRFYKIIKSLSNTTEILQVLREQKIKLPGYCDSCHRHYYAIHLLTSINKTSSIKDVGRSVFVISSVPLQSTIMKCILVFLSAIGLASAGVLQQPSEVVRFSPIIEKIIEDFHFMSRIFLLFNSFCALCTN